MSKRMRTKEILADIESNGGFNNFNHWSLKEIKTWVLSSYPCSGYVAEKVAWELYR